MDKELVLTNFRDFIGENKEEHIKSFQYLLMTDNANNESKLAFAALLALASDE